MGAGLWDWKGFNLGLLRFCGTWRLLGGWTSLGGWVGATAAAFLLGMNLTNRTRVEYVYVYEIDK